jgi:hypothetical protein
VCIAKLHALVAAVKRQNPEANSESANAAIGMVLQPQGLEDSKQSVDATRISIQIEIKIPSERVCTDASSNEHFCNPNLPLTPSTG